MGVIFDLDQTLIDSDCLAALRDARQWQAVYPRISECRPYPGMDELIAELHAAGIPLGIVSSSPRPYCERVVTYFGWPIPVNQIVAYHDTTRRKPYPDPMYEILRRIGVEAAAAVAVGDLVKDIESARAAGIYAIGAAWGITDPEILARSCPDEMCYAVEDLVTILRRQFKLPTT